MFPTVAGGLEMEYVWDLCVCVSEGRTLNWIDDEIGILPFTHSPNFLFKPYILLGVLLSNIINICVSVTVIDQVAHLYKVPRVIIVLYTVY
jgi:hypothetical protein